MPAWFAGFRVQGSGFRVQGSGFRVQGSGFRVLLSGFRVHGLGCKVWGGERTEYTVKGLGFSFGLMVRFGI